MRNFFLTIILLLFSICSHAQSQATKNLTIDLQEIKLAAALHFVAKLIPLNIIISPNVRGMVSLHLQQVSPIKTFEMLLTAHELTKVSLGNTWLIVPRTQWLQREQEEIKLSDTLDNFAPLVTRIWQIHYAKAEDIARLLQDNANSLLSKRGHVRVDSRTNIVCVQDTEKFLTPIHAFIQRVDVPVQQVLIETHLASIDTDYERSLGIKFGVSDGVPAGAAFFSKTHYGLLVGKLADGSVLDVQLSAMEATGHGELISSPRLFTANQQTAAIEAGEEIPYQEESLSGGTAVAFKKAVLSLKVTPQILPGHKIMLQVQVNQDKPSKRVVQGVPAINTRQLLTNVLVRDGETVVLGGIYESDREQSKQSIPFLGTIPILGLLFQQQDVINNKRKLLIFVTPKIIPQEG